MKTSADSKSNDVPPKRVDVSTNLIAGSGTGGVWWVKLPIFSKFNVSAKWNERTVEIDYVETDRFLWWLSGRRCHEPKGQKYDNETPYSGLIVKADHWVQYTVSPILSFNNDKDSLP